MKVFDLRKYRDAGEAFEYTEAFTHYDEDEEIPNLLIFKNKTYEFTSETTGPDDNFTEYFYEEVFLSEVEIEEYLKGAE